ncbi:hypothetical protein ACS0TY_000051 [Phlomoides rotata]
MTASLWRKLTPKTNLMKCGLIGLNTFRKMLSSKCSLYCFSYILSLYDIMYLIKIIFSFLSGWSLMEYVIWNMFCEFSCIS